MDDDLSAVTSESLLALARIARAKVSPKHVAGLVIALREQISAFEELERLTLDDVEPSMTFDPRWRG